VDLKTVRLVDLASDARLSITTIGPPPLHAQIKATPEGKKYIDERDGQDCRRPLVGWQRNHSAGVAKPDAVM
jgi:hypothetical protein